MSAHWPDAAPAVAKPDVSGGGGLSMSLVPFSSAHLPLLSLRRRRRSSGTGVARAGRLGYLDAPAAAAFLTEPAAMRSGGLGGKGRQILACATVVQRAMVDRVADSKRRRWAQISLVGWSLWRSLRAASCAKDDPRIACAPVITPRQSVPRASPKATKRLARL